MINFFRRIRYNLMEKNKTSKYFKYAIGEILLVVIGILIALQINNWNEFRKERIQETAILKQLHSEFKSNIKQLDEKIASKEELMKSALKLFNYIDDPKLRNKDSINYHLGRTIPYTTFDPIVNDLASSGNLRLIENDSLKQLLSFWTSEIKDVYEDDANWKDYRTEIYVQFVIKHYQLRTVRSKATRSNVLGRYLIDEDHISELDQIANIGLTNHPENYNVLLDHPDYEDHLERCFTKNKFARLQSLILRERIVSILEILNSEINYK